MAQREVAYTFLDVKYPQIICKGCQAEFEYLESDCTHPNVSFQPPTGTSKGSKGKSKGSAKGSDGVPKGKGRGAFAEYKGKGKGKGEGGTTGDVDIMAILKQYGTGIISEQQAMLIKSAMKI